MRKVEVSLDIRVPAATIISAFTEAGMLRDWWAVERSLIEKRTGGLYTLAWGITEKGFGYVSTGSVQEYDPAGLLVIGNFTYLNPEKSILGPMTLRVNATPTTANTSSLYLCQDGYQIGGDWDWYYKVVTDAWPTVAVTLKNYLEKKS